MKKSIEKALMEFLADIRITGAERKKGIPLITFVLSCPDWKGMWLGKWLHPLNNKRNNKTISKKGAAWSK